VRDRVLLLGNGEIRLFGEPNSILLKRRILAFAALARGGTHLGVDPDAAHSLAYEAFPIAGWKARAETYQDWSALVLAEHGVFLPNPLVLRTFEQALSNA
jgi:hypothetical protein